MMQQKNESRAMVRVILTLAWPTMLEQMSQSAVQYIDTAMVGALGTQATAAVGATSTVGWLVNSSITAFGVGFLAIISRACGAQDTRMAQRAAAQAVLAVLAIGTFFTVLPTALSGVIPVWMRVEPHILPTASRYFLVLYLPMLPRTASMIFGIALRAAGDTRTPMKVGLWVNCVNVVLNFLLIYPTRTATLLGRAFTVPGAGMGVVGASSRDLPKGGAPAAGPGHSPALPPHRPAQYVSAVWNLSGLCGLCRHDQLPGGGGHRRPHHCQHCGIRLLYPRLWDADRRRHLDGQRLRRR